MDDRYMPLLKLDEGELRARTAACAEVAWP
jgi:hypothetical protein